MGRCDSYAVRRTLNVNGRSYGYYSLAAVEAAGLGPVSQLPVALKVVLENLLRHEDGETVTAKDIAALASWPTTGRRAEREIAFRPARVMMPDSSGIPLLADFAAMRDAVTRLGGDPRAVNPAIPIDFIVDHSVMVDVSGRPDALERNLELEYARNGERYAFLRWCQGAFEKLRVIPPGAGICHQINLEYLATVVASAETADGLVAFPDSLLGMDSHTPMINGLGVLGWGVGGLEAGATVVGEPVYMLIPEVVGCRLSGQLAEGVTATDLVLAVTQRLRAFGVVAKFVEFTGPGAQRLPLSARATLANMAPEYGATAGFFPIDAETLHYLELTGRTPERIALVEAYAKAQGLWRDASNPEAAYSDVLDIELGAIETSIAGPKRPQDRLGLAEVPAAFSSSIEDADADAAVPVAGADYALHQGDVVIAAITSCTNTSNPDVMIAAGLLAQKAVARGLRTKPWVKTSLAPGSLVVADYLRKAGLQEALDTLGFQVAGFGCTTCMGNSGPLAAPLVEAIDAGDLVVAAVLSGNRNFEGRVHPATRANFLASPPLVVAYALAGSVRRDLRGEPLGVDGDGKPMHLSDIWPSDAEVAAAAARTLSPELFRARYDRILEGDRRWRELPALRGDTYAWSKTSTYLREPLLFAGTGREPSPLQDIVGARPLAILGDNVTTDHISPVGSIPTDGPAGRYLQSLGVRPEDFNSFAARRVHYEVLIRGTLANIRLKNELAPGAAGGVTLHMPDGDAMPIYDAAERYRTEGVPLVLVAGKEYGAGSSRDWAAKGLRFLGVRAVIAEGFERIHRSNLIGMGVLPLQFTAGVTRSTLGLRGDELFDLTGIAAGVKPRMTVACTLRRTDGSTTCIELLARLDTTREGESYRHGGILNFVLREMLARPRSREVMSQ